MSALLQPGWQAPPTRAGRDDPSGSNRLAPRFAAPWRIIAVAAAIVALSLGGGWLVDQLGYQAQPAGCDTVNFMITTAVVAYVFAMALPFVPGVEIGLALMLLLDDSGILIVYLSTQFALALSFLLGRLVPTPMTIAAFRWLGLKRAGQFVKEMQALSPAERAASLARRAPAPYLTLLARHRYLALAAVLNLPGNAIIGGAGGIAMIAGMSRAFPFPQFALVIALATTPVPLFLILSKVCGSS